MFPSRLPLLHCRAGHPHPARPRETGPASPRSPAIRENNGPCQPRRLPRLHCSLMAVGRYLGYRYVFRQEGKTLTCENGFRFEFREKNCYRYGICFCSKSLRHLCINRIREPVRGVSYFPENHTCFFSILNSIRPGSSSSSTGGKKQNGKHTYQKHQDFLPRQPTEYLIRRVL